MPLQKQKIPVPLFQGIDTKTDDKQLPVGTLQVAENVTFESPGKLIKRNGYNSLTLSTTDATTIATFGLDKLNIKSIMPRDKELVSVTSDSLYSFSKTINKWIRRGSVADVQSSSFTVYRGVSAAINSTCLYVQGLKIVASTIGNSVGYSVIDPDNNNTNHEVFLTTGITLPQITVATTDGSFGIHLRLANIGNTIFLFYDNGSNLTYITFNLSDPSLFTAPVNVVSDLNTAGEIYDVLSVSDGIFVAYKQSGDKLVFFKLIADLSLTVLQSQPITGITNINLDSNKAGGVIFSIISGTVLRFFVARENMFSNLIGLQTIDTQSPAINHATAIYVNGIYTIYYEVKDSSTSINYYIKSNTVLSNGTVGTPKVFRRSVGLAGKAFTINITPEVMYPFVPSIHVSALQSTIFLLDRDGIVVSTLSSGTSGGFITVNDALPQIGVIDSDTILFSSLFTSLLVTDSGSFSSVEGIQTSIFSFNLSNPNQSGTLAQTLHIANGVLTMYDGVRALEHGFFVYPENVTYSITTGSGSIAAGQYQYQVVYAWTDNLGQIHRSAPSIAITVTTVAANNTVILTIPTLRLTEKNAIIEVYRTENLQTIFYKVTSTTFPLLNDTTVDTITFSDSLADSDIISHEPIYTTGGVLENIVAPQSSICEVYNNRVWLSGLDDPNKIVFSKIRNEGYPVEFNDGLYRLINPYGGNIMSIKAMDDKLVIFKETAIYYIAGNGPNNLGQLDDFIDATLISSDVGCVNRDSVVIAPDGLFFQSSKGIYLLSRSLQVGYVGAQVEAYNGLTITSAKTVQTKNTVRFGTEEGTTLVYNYFLQKWSTFTNMPSYDAEVIYGSYYYLRTDGSIYNESSAFDDNGTDISMSITTGWISFAGVQGLQRIYRMLILGSFYSQHRLKVSIAYDYVDAFTDEVIVDPSTFTDSSTFGSYSPFGSEPTFGALNLYQMRINFTKQKCKSIKVKIEDISAVNGQSMSLSNLLFYIGVKQSPGQLGSANVSATT